MIGLAAASAGRLTLIRVLAAPRQIVFSAWSAVERQARWLGPENWTVLGCLGTVRAGARYRVTLQLPDLQHASLQGEYLEVVAPEHIEFTCEWTRQGVDTLRIRAHLALVEYGDRTLLRLQHEPGAGSGSGFQDFWVQSLNRLASQAAWRWAEVIGQAGEGSPVY